ncbi:MAG: BadF/BadG/BcrA/BcrD ATPase family protein, partial [Pseudomonadota bacterium]|nr:BadF/BadG/BcrA/BcrD ATPase family protein [Pseudomonadota bacterium]
MLERYLGIDVGAETVKVAELTVDGGDLRWTARHRLEHHSQPGPQLLCQLGDLDWENVSGASVTGRLGRLLTLPRIPIKQAQSVGHRHLHGETEVTIVSIGSHGFSVLEILPEGTDQFRQNSRCSQGTGNFLRQLVERFQLSVEEASELCEDVEDPAPLSGRCPVILKSDMTHLANRGECRAGILAGLYDAVCENVFVLVKPTSSPPLVRMIGGVGRSRRIRSTFGQLLERRGLELAPPNEDDELFYEALGCAVLASEAQQRPPVLACLLGEPEQNCFEEVPALAEFLAMVDRRPAAPVAAVRGDDQRLVVGYDIGSTGSKAVALDVENREIVWQGYVNTNGDPVAAAHGLTRELLAGPAGGCAVMAVGTTGSGREIAGSLLASCFGGESVFILNEIAAHAAGALHYDPDVDTIFEIGGQDAKYVRLEQGRVIDAAMNEACSAGTGSFIEEQGKKFADVENVVQLGEQALSACGGASLGQHCSVFMAEVIDECVAAG